MFIVQTTKLRRRVRIWACANREDGDVASVAVGRNDRVVRGLALLGRTSRVQEG